MTGEPPRQNRSEEEREAARLARERARAERAAKQDAKGGAMPPRARKPLRPRAKPRGAEPPPPAKKPLRPDARPHKPQVPRATASAPGADPSEPDAPHRGLRKPAPDQVRAEPRAPRAGLRKPQRPSLPKPSLRRGRSASGDAADATAAATPEPLPPATPAARAVPDRASVRERADVLLSSRRESPPGAPGSARGFRRGRIVALAVLALAGLFGLWLVFALFQPGKGEGEGNVAITIPAGSGVGDIGGLLSERGVVDSGTMFELRTTLAGSRGDLKPGTYTLRRDMSYGAAIDALSQGPSPNLVNVTIPEGTARREVAGRVREAGLRGNYVRATARSSSLNPRRYGAERARDLEGFLFPATYQLQRRSSVKSLVDKQLAAFKENWAKVDLAAARRANLTPYDVLIIASLVEREARLDKERPLVASVVYNRLRAGMNLGIDATVRYALNNWTEPLKRSDLASPSPYNTYVKPGLPPGPIGNPGLASMQAAARPASTKYLYYVVKPNTCGEHAFAETADEHDRNAARYNEARAARGGQSPTDC